MANTMSAITTLSSNSMNHNHQTSLAGYSNDYEALFVDGVVWVWDRNRKRVIENGACLRKSDTVLPEIHRVLSPVPLKSDSTHLLSSLANRDGALEDAVGRSNRPGGLSYRLAAVSDSPFKPH